ncbi:MAG: HD domain-containing protein [Hominisplanchenecus sp.]
MDRQHAKLTAAMVAYDRGDAKRIQHFLKVHDLAAVIGTLEGLDEETQFILETAAILHDIGIHISEQKYGSCSGKYQEKEGPAEARKLMEQVGGYTEEQMQRVEYLIGHHHTYQDRKGMDYQILVEADFLVNLYEDGSGEQTRDSVRRKIFRTRTGIQLLTDMFAMQK